MQLRWGRYRISPFKSCFLLPEKMLYPQILEFRLYLSLSLFLQQFCFVLTNYKLIGPERCCVLKQFDFDELANSDKNCFIKKAFFLAALSNAPMLRIAEEKLCKPGDIMGILINICHFLHFDCLAEKIDLKNQRTISQSHYEKRGMGCFIFFC